MWLRLFFKIFFVPRCIKIIIFLYISRCLFVLLLFLHLFESMVAFVFQNTFRDEIHQNNFFYFFKIIFKISASKRFKTYKKINFFLKNGLVRTFYSFYLFKFEWESILSVLCIKNKFIFLKFKNFPFIFSFLCNSLY